MCNLSAPLRRRLYAAVSVIAGLVFGLATSAAPAATLSGREVFVQTNNPAGNSIVVYNRAENGTLTQTGVFRTGGLGDALNGTGVDPLSSQDSLVLDRPARLLFAVNAGSNTMSMFAVDGERLFLLQVISSGGTFPVSVAIHDNVVYALNARDGGSVQGYLLFGGHLIAVPQWHRDLGLDQSFQNTPNEFFYSPGEVLFTPDGSHLLVSTKDNGDDIEAFAVDRDGGLSASPVLSKAGETPFAMTFDRSGHLVVTETGTSSIVSFDMYPNGQFTPVSTVLTGQGASCWITPAGPNGLYVGNAFSASESVIGDNAGDLTLLGTTPTDPGTVDGVATPNGRFLYVQTGANDIVDEFAIARTGALTEIGAVAIPAPDSSEGIATS